MQIMISASPDENESGTAQPQLVSYKHQVIQHMNETANFEIEGVFNEAVSRQSNESVRFHSR